MNFDQLNKLPAPLFASSAIKDIFDNVRNTLIATTVFMAGNYLQPKHFPDAVSPYFVTLTGLLLVGFGCILMLLSVMHGYALLKKISPKRFFTWPITGVYFVFVSMLFVSVLQSKGFTL